MAHDPASDSDVMADPREVLAGVSAQLRAWLDRERRAGGLGLPAVSVAQTTPSAAPAQAPAQRTAAAGASERTAVEAVASGAAADVTPADSTPAPAQGKRQRLEVLASEAKACTACKLHAGRTHSVFARGNPDAALVFVGEGPGYDEDMQGLPFVGRAGKLLDRMIAAMGLGEDEVYICNVVKCRPPENRTPLPDEAQACARFLEPQLELVAPRCIVALGKCAAQHLGVAPPQGRWRGSWRSWRGVPVMPTYHPAFLLRSPQFKRPVWEDLQQVMARLRTGT